MVNCGINPVQLNTDMTGTFDVFGNMVKLVNCNCQLQQRNGQHREPRRTSPQD